MNFNFFYEIIVKVTTMIVGSIFMFLASGFVGIKYKDWNESIFHYEIHTPIATEMMLTICIFILLSILGYLILRFAKVNKISPLALVLAMSALYIGAIVAGLWIGQVFKMDIKYALSALAWIGDEEVVNAFNEWRINKPDFTARLYILPHEYSYEGGWKLDDKGKKKELIFNQCYGISEENSMTDDAVIYLEENEEQCGVCGRKLTSLITINLNNNYMRFFNIEGEYINISSCDYCGCYGVWRRNLLLLYL